MSMVTVVVSVSLTRRMLPLPFCTFSEKVKLRLAAGAFTPPSAGVLLVSVGAAVSIR